MKKKGLPTVWEVLNYVAWLRETYLERTSTEADEYYRGVYAQRAEALYEVLRRFTK